MKFKHDPAEEYARYLRETNGHASGTLGNKLLYDLCKKHPCHIDADEIHSKVWLIGRAYAAAIERGRNKGKQNKEDSSDHFYRDVVVPAFQEKAGILDAEIKELNDSKKGPRENAERILSLHKILVDTINKFTETNKRSFASKYLHFHCPQQFPIFDSRASSAAQRIAQRLNHSDFPESWKKCDHDPQYADFFARVLAIKEKIETERRTKVSPRDIDNFLLFFDDKH